MIQLAELGPGARLVDVGCGPGEAAARAARAGAEVVGIDPARVMRSLARLLGRGRAAQFVAGKAEDLPLLDDHATVVWSLSAVHHWPDLDAGLVEVRRY